jgi:hypothetical protein
VRFVARFTGFRAIFGAALAGVFRLIAFFFVVSLGIDLDASFV